METELYFITVYAISIALSVVTGELDQSIQYSQQQGGYGELNEEQKALVQEGLADVNEMLTKRMDLVAFLMVPLIAVFTRLHNFRSGKNLAETLSFQSFLWGHIGLLSIPMIPTIYLSLSVNFWVKNLLVVFLFYYGIKVFYDRSWLRSLLSLVFVLLYNVIAAILSVQILLGIRNLGFL